MQKCIRANRKTCADVQICEIRNSNSDVVCRQMRTQTCKSKNRDGKNSLVRVGV